MYVNINFWRFTCPLLHKSDKAVGLFYSLLERKDVPSDPSFSYIASLSNAYRTLAYFAAATGLRSPHKLKSAVSGCVRECAEAQGKDFGMVATENGYNLYVCGNGGAVARLVAGNMLRSSGISVHCDYVVVVSRSCVSSRFSRVALCFFLSQMTPVSIGGSRDLVQSRVQRRLFFSLEAAKNQPINSGCASDSLLSWAAECSHLSKLRSEVAASSCRVGLAVPWTDLAVKHLPFRPTILPSDHRHADLLATDISAELCIKYIDRFLMFYIATAERLQRTSTWMDKLEGGAIMKQSY